MIFCLESFSYHAFFYFWREKEVIFVEDMTFKQLFPLSLSHLPLFESFLFDLLHMPITSKFLKKDRDSSDFFCLFKFRSQQGWFLVSVVLPSTGVRKRLSIPVCPNKEG